MHEKFYERDVLLFGLHYSKLVLLQHVFLCGIQSQTNKSEFLTPWNFLYFAREKDQAYFEVIQYLNLSA